MAVNDDACQRLALRFGKGIVDAGFQHFGVAQHGIDGRAQVVADMRQQRRLEAQRLQRLIARHRQFLRRALAIGTSKASPISPMTLPASSLTGTFFVSSTISAGGTPMVSLPTSRGSPCAMARE